MKKLLLLSALTIVFVNVLFSQNVPSYVPTNGLVGYWPFNGNANDESGNGNNGTVTGATLTTDRNGNLNSAYSFKGSATPENSGGGVDYINVIPKNSINTSILDGLTISAWFNLNDLNSNSTIFNLSNNSTNETYGVVFDKMTKLISGQNGVFNSNPIIDIHNSQIPIINNWYHVVLSVDYLTNKTSLYINGKLDAESSNNPIKTNLDRFKMGNWNDNGYWFANGKLDDFGVWNRALSQKEITALYTGNTAATVPSYVPTNGLVGYWPFNGNANDESGKSHNGTLAGATLTADRNGISNKAYDFSGTNDYIEIATNDGQFNSQSYTYSFWTKNTSFSTQPALISRLSTASGGQNTYDNFCLFAAGGKANINYKSTNGNMLSSANDGNGPDMSGNIWKHIVIAVNSDSIRSYLNGVLIKKEAFKFGINFNNQYALRLGRSSHTFWDDYNGKLDDIAIYNRALTQQEITNLFNGNSQSALSSTKVFVDAPASVKQNDTLELSISTEALNTVDNVIAYQTDFTYDTTRYAYIGSNLVGTLNSAGSVDINTSKKGLLKLGYMSQTALNGAGSLVKLKFKANNTLGQGIFGLSNFLYNTTTITSLKSDTVTTLDAIPPSAKLSYSQNPVRKGDSLLITVKYSEKMAIAPVPQLNLTGQNTLANANLTKVNDTTYTYWWVVEKGNGLVNVTLASGKDLAGNNIVATPTQNASFTVLPTLFGDIDTNKFVQAYDGALALQYSVGLNPLPTMDPLPWSNWRIAVANVDTVGNITANDASLILQKSIDKIASFPADAKKRGDAPLANITVTQEANQLVFRATGTLYAFNVFMKDNFNAFGQPEVKDKNAMIATNITSTTYNVGLASTTPFAENEPFLILPILTNDNLQGTMNIVANAQEKALAYGAALSTLELNKEMLIVYPNPTKDVVTINNAQGKTLRIVDFQGRLVNTQIVTSNAHDVSLKAIATKGEYIFQLIGENNETIATQKVVMQ